MKTKILLLFLNMTLLFLSFHPLKAFAQPELASNPYPARLTLNQISTLSNSTNWFDRWRAANSVIDAIDFDTTTAVSTIVTGIANELNDPVNPTFADLGLGIIPGMDDIIRKYLDNLSILGPNILSMIIEHQNLNNPSLNIWLIIARGMLKDESIKDSLEVIARVNLNPNIRSLAIRAISNFKDVNDLSIFKESLKDTSYFSITEDFSVDGNGLLRRRYYPVRIEAINGLKKLGYKVLPDSVGGYNIEKR